MFRKELLIEFRKRGYEVLAVAPEESTAVREALAALGINFRIIPLARTGTNAFADLRSIGVLSSLLREYRPDVVIPYTIKPVLYTLLAAFGKRTTIYPMITGVGNWGAARPGFLSRLFMGVLFGVFRLAVRNATGIIFQNADDLKLFVDKKVVNPDKTRTIIVSGSGVNINAYSFVPPPAGPATKFLLVGRLLQSKGVSYYIAAAEEIRRRYPGKSEFHLIGQQDPGNPDALDESILSRAVKTSTIVYHGFCDDIRPVLQSCDVFVLPSYYREGIPRTLLEALACGRPVITTDHIGCRETVIAGENGFLVQPKDVGSLVEAMEKFVTHSVDAAQMGRRSRRLAEERFDVDIVNRDILKFMNVA